MFFGRDDLKLLAIFIFFQDHTHHIAEKKQFETFFNLNKISL